MNSGLQVSNEQAKLAQWAQVVAQCRDSGMSVRQWCQCFLLLQVAAEGLCRSPGTTGAQFRGGNAGAVGGCWRCGGVTSANCTFCWALTMSKCRLCQW